MAAKDKNASFLCDFDVVVGGLSFNSGYRLGNCIVWLCDVFSVLRLNIALVVYLDAIHGLNSSWRLLL